MPDPVVLLEVDKRGVATITLNRPEVNNAYNGEFVKAMICLLYTSPSPRDRG